MSLSAQVLTEKDIFQINEIEYKKIQDLFADENERKLALWSSRAKEENLHHYLSLGWSYGFFDNDNNLAAYFLGQPLLFFDGQMQSLWLEHLHFSSLQSRDFLCEFAFFLAKDKHFQRVYYPKLDGIMNSIIIFKPMEWGSGYVFLKTTKG